MMKWTAGVVAGLMLTSALGGCAKQGSNEGGGKAADAAKPVCDRDCLLKLTDAYVASFAKHSLDGVAIEPAASFSGWLVDRLERLRASGGAEANQGYA